MLILLGASLATSSFAPSSINTQPWKFVHEKDLIHLYYEKHSIISKLPLEYFNHIDLGIALAHLYVSNKDTFNFNRIEPYTVNRKYIGSVQI